VHAKGIKEKRGGKEEVGGRYSYCT